MILTLFLEYLSFSEKNQICFFANILCNQYYLQKTFLPVGNSHTPTCKMIHFSSATFKLSDYRTDVWCVRTTSMPKMPYLYVVNWIDFRPKDRFKRFLKDLSEGIGGFFVQSRNPTQKNNNYNSNINSPTKRDHLIHWDICEVVLLHKHMLVQPK